MTQVFKQKAQQRASSDVQTIYPHVYRTDEEQRNHALAVAQQEIQQQPNGDASAVQDYVEAYIAAYRQAVAERDRHKSI